jgi:pimeloyl-ACP methyl ester carboxylesterase
MAQERPVTPERGAPAPFVWTQAVVRRALGAALAAFVPLVVLVNLAVETVPHPRGIAFVPQLRYGLVTPACGAGAAGAALLFSFLAARVDRPRPALAAGLGAVALALLALLGLGGPPGLVRAAWPAILVWTVTLSLLVPRLVERPRGRVVTAALAILGAIEIAGVVLALGGERVGPRGPGEMAFEVPRALFDVDHHFVDLPGGARVHYVDEGKGPVLLFLHGNPSWSFQWRDLIGGLRGSFRCVALDYPGFGLSPSPPGYGFTAREQSRVVEEFVDHLGLRDVTLVMQDWGGPIGLGLAGRRPELIRRVVLGNTWAWPTSTGEARGKFSVIVGGPIGEFAQMNFNAFASFGLAHGVLHPLPEEVFATYLRPFRPLDRRGVAAFYPGQITAASGYLGEVEAGLARVGDRRALIFWGMRDQGFPRADLARFERAFPRHETIELAGADHFFFEDAAAPMITAIGAFAGAAD